MKWASIGSGNGLSLVWHLAITWTNPGLLSNGFLGTNFREVQIGILSFSFRKMHLKLSSAKMAAILSRERWDNHNWVAFLGSSWYVISHLIIISMHEKNNRSTLLRCNKCYHTRPEINALKRCATPPYNYSGQHYWLFVRYDSISSIAKGFAKRSWKICILWQDDMCHIFSCLSFCNELGHHLLFNLSPPGQNGHHFADDIFICIFKNEKFCLLIKFHPSRFLGVQLTITQHWFR